MNDSPTLTPLFERVRIFLADGDFAKADEYCERILDIEPTNWEAYYLKFIAALKLRDEAMLSGVTVPFGSIPVYQKVLQYAPKEVLDRLATIETANYNRLIEQKFKEAQNLEKIAITAFDFAKAAVAFEALGTYRNSGERAKACRQKSNQLAAEGHRRVRKGIIIVAIILVALYAALFTVNAIYQSSPSANFLYAHTPDGISIIQAKNKNIKSLKIPETIDGKPVVSIGDSAFADCDKLKTVTLPDTLVSIGNQAFMGCESLDEVNFPTSGSLTTIGESAFDGCHVFKVIHIPEGVTTIGKKAFANITYIEEMVIPSTVKELDNPFYESCVERLTMPNILDFYGSRYMPLGLRTLVLTKSEKQTLGSGFIELPFLTTLVLPEGITMITKGLFTTNTHLVSITIPEGVKIIDTEAFFGCTSLEEVILPKSLTKIYGDAFCNCTSLERIVIPEGVTEIQAYAFGGCYNLTVYCEKEFDNSNGTLYDYKWDHVFSGSNDKIKVVYGYKES